LVEKVLHHSSIKEKAHEATTSVPRPMAYATGAAMVTMPLKSHIEYSTPRLAKDTFQVRAHGVLEYLVGTLRNTW
jgi:hypothetical protein